MSERKPSGKRKTSAAPPGSRLAPAVCPRCGRKGGEELGTSSGSTWLHCNFCSHLWRRLDPETDAFSLILASRAADAQLVDETQQGAGIPRASRFSVQLEIRYRGARDRQWRVGHTRNISRSGVLFSADAPLDLETPVELVLVLPGTVAGEPPSHLRCRGQVVRTTDEQPPYVAAAVSAYRLASV
jgi:hypothetical protein